MKRKIFKVIIDLALIMGILFIGDMLALKVFHCEKIWLDIVLYIVLYCDIWYKALECYSLETKEIQRVRGGRQKNNRKL